MPNTLHPQNTPTIRGTGITRLLPSDNNIRQFRKKEGCLVQFASSLLFILSPPSCFFTVPLSCLLPKEERLGVSQTHIYSASIAFSSNGFRLLLTTWMNSFWWNFLLPPCFHVFRLYLHDFNPSGWKINQYLPQFNWSLLCKKMGSDYSQMSPESTSTSATTMTPFHTTSTSYDLEPFFFFWLPSTELSPRQSSA